MPTSLMDSHNYAQFVNGEWDGQCPRCKSTARQVLEPQSLGGICTADKSYKCVDCGLHFDIVPPYDKW